jgi:hypothetical protein
MGKRAITFYELTCERCGYKWIPETSKEPGYCASCNSPYWNKPRKNKKKQPVKQQIKQPVKLPTRGRGGSFQTAARADMPKAVRNYIRHAKPPVRKPSQREINNAGIGGAT